MNIVVFSKKRTGADNRPFNTYLTRLKWKDGSEKAVTLKFKCDPPRETPCNIVVDKANANLKTRSFISKTDGTLQDGYTLFIESYTMGEPYVDHSCDDLAD